MAEPFLAEIRIVGFNFAPRGWGACDGQVLPINQNQSLYSLLGTLYGGDGRTTFALPDLRGRTPIHVGRSDGSGSEHREGEKAGQETHTLSQGEMPDHAHTAFASTQNADQASASGAVLGAAANFYVSQNPSPPRQPLSPATAATVGWGQAHDNMQPYIAVNFCIALRGLFPSRN